MTSIVKNLVITQRTYQETLLTRYTFFFFFPEELITWNMRQSAINFYKSSKGSSLKLCAGKQ